MTILTRPWIKHLLPSSNSRLKCPPTVQVPPEELLEEEEDDIPPSGKENKVIKGKAKTNDNRDHFDEEEDDTFSDLLGSDHGDELDEDDEIDGDSENEFDPIDIDDSGVVNKIDKKGATNGKLLSKGLDKKDVRRTEPLKSKKIVKRKSDEDTTSAPNKKIKKGAMVSEEKFTGTKKMLIKIKG